MDRSNLIKRFEKNTKGRDFVVGDIHGCFALLFELLEKVDFNIFFDRLFSVGDLVDRGPESELVLKYVKYPWFHAVRGNHEDMFLGVMNNSWPINNYITNGGKWATETNETTNREIEEELKLLPLIIEVETDQGLIGILHADVPGDDWVSMKERLTDPDINPEYLYNQIMWGRDRISRNKKTNVNGIEKVIVGHTPVQSPKELGNVLYIDTGACFKEKLTMVELNKDYTQYHIKWKAP